MNNLSFIYLLKMNDTDLQNYINEVWSVYDVNNSNKM